MGEHIWLEGYQLEHDVSEEYVTLQAGETVQLTLYWRTTSSTRKQHAVFNHIVDSNGAKHGQLDGQPGCDINPTDRWAVGGLIPDHYDIPLSPDTPPGNYSLFVGMYDTQSFERLEVYDVNGKSLGDVIELAKIIVVP